jgi:hypothetical protein
MSDLILALMGVFFLWCHLPEIQNTQPGRVRLDFTQYDDGQVLQATEEQLNILGKKPEPG